MSTLQELLNLGLVDIGSDDSRFAKMQTASAALTARFKQDPHILVPATLVALDEETDENEPYFDLVEDLVSSEWKTLRNTHVNRPRELLRSITIDAIAVSVAEDAQVAAVVWNTAVSPIRHRQVKLGKAAGVIEHIVQGAGKLAEKDAVMRAGFIDGATKTRPPKKFTSPKKAAFKFAATIGDSDVLADVARSAGPQNGYVASLEDPNPHWPNQQAAWANEFATRMATALSGAVNLGSSRLAKSFGEEYARCLGEFERQLTEQCQYVEQLSAEMMQMNQSSRVRLDVLWWSEALYSPLLQLGYRELDSSVAAVAAAIDLSNIVPAQSPASVAYVLDEALRRAFPAASDNPRSVRSFLEGIADGGAKLRGLIPTVQVAAGGVPLIDLVGSAIAGSSVSDNDCHERAGIDPALTLSPGELAMWIFRCAQARRLVETLR